MQESLKEDWGEGGGVSAPAWVAMWPLGLGGQMCAHACLWVFVSRHGMGCLGCQEPVLCLCKDVMRVLS